ncbi:MAG: hypothetical protein D6685_06290 [Bacteroidetes bacterium]|nr:MAG: hypothetical protein D6685_06290 [Bacteroidota bacterium]
MQYMLDLISAFLMGASLLLIIFSVMLRGQEASIGVTQHAAARQGVATLAQMLEQDLNNIGARQPDNDLAITHLALDTSAAAPYYLAFWSVPDTTGQARLTCYYWEPDDSVAVYVGNVLQYRPTYRVERRLGPRPPNGSTCPNWAPAGFGPGTLTHFHIELRDAQDNPILDLAGADQTRRIRVEAEAVSPLGPSRLIEAARWQATLAPPNLNRTD